MSANVLTPARVSHRLAATKASTGLWKAMTERVRPTESLSTIEVEGLAPTPSMFDYDPAKAMALTELPDYF